MIRTTDIRATASTPSPGIWTGSRGQFTLEEFNERTLRRYRRWEDVEPPRSDNNVLEMLLFKRFNYENLAGHLQWMIGEVRRIDTVHETRTHGAGTPRPWDETCARFADSWGMSMPSNNLLTGEDPYKIAERAFVFDWSRSIGKGGRWWNEEIYSGMARGGVTWKKQTDPRELTTLLWMTLAHGAAGAMFWQYRPDHVAFESPGYNLATLDGRPTARLGAVSEAISQIEGLSEHLPLRVPKARVAIVNHQASQDLFSMNDEKRPIYRRPTRDVQDALVEWDPCRCRDAGTGLVGLRSRVSAKTSR